MSDQTVQLPYDIFLSYSQADTVTMQQVKSTFESAGLRVWTDEASLAPETPDWREDIDFALQSSTHLVVIFSPEAKQSKRINQNINIAINLDKSVFTLLAKGDKKESIPSRWEFQPHLDIRQEEDFYPNMLSLIFQIQKGAEQNTSHSEQIKLEEPEQEVPSIDYEKFPQIKDHTNPLNWLKILWWLLVTPDVFQGTTHEEWPDNLRKASSWLAAVLVGLPLFTSSLALSLGLVADGDGFIWFYRALLICNIVLIIVLYWAHWKNWRFLFILLGVFMFFLTLVMIEIVANGESDTRLTVAFGVMFTMVGAITLGMKNSKTLSMITTIFTVVAYGLFFGGGILLLSKRIEGCIESRQATFFWNYVIFFVLVASWLYLIWCYWLGGYIAPNSGIPLLPT